MTQNGDQISVLDVPGFGLYESLINFRYEASAISLVDTDLIEEVAFDVSDWICIFLDGFVRKTGKGKSEHDRNASRF